MISIYRKFVTLPREAPEEVFALPENIWKKWAPAILSYPLSGTRDENIHKKLIKIAYQYASKTIIDTLMLLIDKENREYSTIFIIRQIEFCWDKHLADSLLKKAKEIDLKPSCMGTILAFLLDHRFG